jgi:hypothetical protein
VSWYETDDPNTRADTDKILNDLGRQWPQQYPNLACREVSSLARKIDQVIGYGRTWEFRTRDANASFVSAATSILVHPAGQKRGVRIDEYGTSLDPKVKSASDVGSNDDLAGILRTFRFLPGSAASATASAPPLAQAQAALTAADRDAMAAAAIRWLRLLDAGKYQECFATASPKFREGLSAEQFQKTGTRLRAEFGRVVSRSSNVQLATSTSTSSGGAASVTYTIKIQTKFSNKSALEEVTMTKDSGAWAVADYSVSTGQTP